MKHKGLFLFASFLSSLGSLAFAVANIGFLTKEGFSLLQIGLVIFLSRICALIIQLFFSKTTEGANPARLLIHTEGWGAVASIGLLIVWNHDPHRYFGFFLLFIALRAFLMALQNPLRAKMVRLSLGDNRAGEGSFLIWLNKATYGSTALAGVIGLFSLKFLTLSHVIIFDFTTYVIGGFLMFWVQGGCSLPSSQEQGGCNALRICEFFKLSPTLIAQDALLAFAFTGANVMAVRLAFDRGDIVPIYITMFGLSVWVAGFALRTSLSKLPIVAWWFALGVAFASLKILSSAGVWGLPVMFFLGLAYLFYWILFHHYTVVIQSLAPDKLVVQVNAMRTAMATVLLSIGEVIPGLFGEQVYSLSVDLAFRTVLVSFVVSIMIFNQHRLKVKI